MRLSYHFAGALFLLCAALPLTGAAAQGTPAATDPASADANKRLQRVEEQLVDLAAQIGTVESMTRGGAGAHAPGDGAQALAGGDESRLGQIEMEVKALSAQMGDLLRRLQTVEARSGIVPPPPQLQQPGPGGAVSSMPGDQAAPARRMADQGTGFSVGGDGSAPAGAGVQRTPPPSSMSGPANTEPAPDPKPAKKKSGGGLFGISGLFGGDEEEPQSPAARAPESLSPPSQQRPAQIAPNDGGAGGGPARVAAVSAPQAKSLYDSAYGALMQSNYRAAADGFEQFIQRFPADPLTGSAHYWLGEAAFMNGEYRRAADNFLKSTTNYPQGEKAAESMLKLGISLKRLNENEAACSSFNELARRYPDASGVLQRAEAEKRRAKCS